MIFSTLAPGMLVRHPGQPDWGVGQVQSVADFRVTVNFEQTGKVVINAQIIELDVVEEEQW
jgi:transcription elongation factor GreA-like protein